MERKFQRKIEVKIGSRLVLVEQCELDNLLDALSEMRKLTAGGRAFMKLGSA
jgi:hypothetical protein